MRRGVLVVWLLVAVTSVFAATQTSCPVMGGKINPKLYVDAGGYRIYVCCAGCIGAVKADPQKFIEKMKAEGIEIERTPAASKK